MSKNNIKELCKNGDINSDSNNINFIRTDMLSFQNKYFEYDFNGGFRIKFYDCSIYYRLIILDKQTREVVLRHNLKPEKDTIYVTEKKYYIEYEIRIFRIINGMVEPYPLKVITFDVNEKDVLILVAGDKTRAGLGDSIAWMTAVYQFKLLHPSTNVYVHLAYPELEEVFNLKYSNMFTFVHYTDINKHFYYSTYLCGCFFDDKELNLCPVRYEKLSLIDCGCYVLGFEFDETKLLNLSIKDCDNKQSYICISSHASSIYKEWINTTSRDKLVCFLRDLLGYDVYSIDLEKDNTAGPLCKTSISEYSIDNTGDIPLIERIKILSNADFFIGVSSGLSWLAWTCGIPVVLISGFTSPITEFKTPYRVINRYECNSCWNDEKIKWDMSSTNCPRKKNNCFRDDFLMCTSSIHFYSVMNVIKKIPCVKERLENILHDNWCKD
jgi:autotransporter strand-loop-strand O-heptosyltransferase